VIVAGLSGVSGMIECLHEHCDEPAIGAGGLCDEHMEEHAMRCAEIVRMVQDG